MPRNPGQNRRPGVKWVDMPIIESQTVQTSEKPMPNTFPKLHNAMWPGLVGKEPGTDHPPISLDRMLELTANANVDGEQLFSAKELTLEPGSKCTLKDPGASGWITVQGKGRIGKLALQTPAMIRFGQETEDEVFISHEAAATGVEIENTGSEPLVGLRYFGPDVHKKLPQVGDFRK